MAKLKKCLYGVVFAAVISALLCFVCFKQASTYAEEQGVDDYYNYSLVTSEEGEQSYGISIRPAFKPLVKTLVIPDSYNGLPITEISNNGFMSCTNLKRIFLPSSVKKIGNNAFMNCAKLERLILPNVESIGIIIGLNYDGDVYANTWACSGTSKIISTTTDYRYVEWTEGSKKYTHDQWLYVKEEESGRIF